jgi:hypothetical protein
MKRIEETAEFVEIMTIEEAHKSMEMEGFECKTQQRK